MSPEEQNQPQPRTTAVDPFYLPAKFKCHTEIKDGVDVFNANENNTPRLLSKSKCQTPDM